MAECAVFFLLNKLAPLLQEEVKLLSGVREEVEYIRAEFERMTAFLRVADAIEVSDPEIQVWVKQVRDIAHRTEDVLDVFMLQYLLRHHHHHEGYIRYFGFLRKTSRFLKNIKVRHQIASEIQSIKSRVRDIAVGHQRYRLKFNISEQGSSSTTVLINNKWYDSRGDALLITEAELVGIDKPKQELIGLLVEEDHSGPKVVSVVGMGGLGKTTLVKKVYDDAAVKKHFESHAWLIVSESPMMEEVLKDMIQQLFSEIKQPVPQEVERMDINRLKQVINEFLQKKRYLVVFDDVWSIHAWEAVKYVLPNNNSSSRIVLTTRFGDIATTSCIETDGNVYHLNPLSWKDSWTLFCRKAFRGKSCPPQLKEISQSILQRCEGLPLAIVAIGGVLATKNQSRIDEWDMLDRSLGVELQGNKKLQSMKNILSLSYSDLPWYLKICFLYLSIFPADHEIECMRLIRLWMAEGFVQVSEGKTIEEVAEGYLNELLNRSLIQMAETTLDGRVKTCRIHVLLREITTSKSREHNIVAITSERNTRWLEKVRRLSIHNTLRNILQSKRFSQLRSMLMFGVVDPLSKSTAPILFSGSLMLLKVLDLRDAYLETVPDEVFKLFHLRYLSLRGTKVKMLPNSIGDLVNLETLDLKGTYVTMLPVEIHKLRGLRHLLVYSYEALRRRYRQFHSINGIEAITRIGGLSSLQKLCYVKAFCGDGDSIASELGKLTQLRRLGILKLRREDGMALCSSIEKLSNLLSLNVSSTEEDEILDIQSLSSPPQFLRKLYLRGRLEKLPHWIPSLHSLVIVHLGWSKLRDDPLQSLQDLPNLMQIELKHAYEGEELYFKAGRFQRLKRLSLSRLKQLRWVRVEEGAMSHLEGLTISNCELLEEVPSGIEHLTKLQLLDLLDMPIELLMKLDRSRGGADYWKVAHITDVRIGVFRNGRWIVVQNLHRKTM